MNRIIVIILLTSYSVFGQGIIRGVVREMGSGQPLPGAHILVKGSGKGTIAQDDGNFIISLLDPGTYDIEISFVGHLSQTLSIEVTEHSPTNLSVLLIPGKFQLDDVTVSSVTPSTLNILSPYDIRLRPANTAQDILRMVPGLFIAQHAGGGKAEQIFLRGFDIDHGTDINLEVDGIPVNMVSHAHGQGYSDLHFLIPELVQVVDFNKGLYFADKGDFTTAGYVDFKTKNTLENNFTKAEVGQYGMLRNVIGINFIASEEENKSGYVASEIFRTDGFFESPQKFNRINVTGKLVLAPGAGQQVTVGSSYFTSSWNASGQIPERAVKSGEISKFGSIDDTEGGKTNRFNFYAKHKYQFAKGAELNQLLYGILYNFNLYSNFTFYLNNPVEGDQIQQRESRLIYGYKASYVTETRFLGKKLQTHGGGGIRYDDIRDIALSNTVKREFRSDVQRGNVSEVNANLFISETLALNNRWSINAALRFDYFMFGYDDRLISQSNKETAAIVSPKLNLAVEVSDNTSLYIRSGTGFHSNDARLVIDQNVNHVLPRAFGADLGIYTKAGTNLLLHAAIWRLDMDQEFVYVGDAGIVEPSGKTIRQGADLSLRYQLLSWLFADTDITFAIPRLKGVPDGENSISLAPTLSSIGGFTVKGKDGWNGSLRYRYLDDRPANEKNSVVADGYFLLDAVVNYTRPKFEIGITVENLLNQFWKEAQFDTESKLQNEINSVSEIHFTPGTPLFAKLKITYLF